MIFAGWYMRLHGNKPIDSVYMTWAGHNLGHYHSCGAQSTQLYLHNDWSVGSNAWKS